MPLTGQKGARSKLADVLADIKNSRGEDDVGGTRPTPAKRRFTLNYAASNSQTPRQSRSSTTNLGSGQTTKAHNTSSPGRVKTYVLKFVDNSVDLSQFLHATKKSGATREPSLYPIIRAWIQNQDLTCPNQPDNSATDVCSGSNGSVEQADDDKRQHTTTVVHEGEHKTSIDASPERRGAAERKIERKQIHNADQICSFLRERKIKRGINRG